MALEHLLFELCTTQTYGNRWKEVIGRYIFNPPFPPPSGGGIKKCDTK